MFFSVITRLICISLLGSPFLIPVLAGAATCEMEKEAKYRSEISRLEDELAEQIFSAEPVLEDTQKVLMEAEIARRELRRKVPGLPVSPSLDDQALKMAASAFAPFKEEIEKSMGSDDTKPPTEPADILREKIKSLYKAAIQKIEPAVNAESEASLTEAEFLVAQQKAYSELALQVQKYLVELKEKIAQRFVKNCEEDVRALVVQVEGQRLQLINCIPTSKNENLEFEGWGGKIAKDQCRHLTLCSDVKGPKDPLFISGFWVLDCRKTKGVCPSIKECALQTFEGSPDRAAKAGLAPLSRPEGSTK